jgi:hypothetical protein
MDILGLNLNYWICIFLIVVLLIFNVFQARTTTGLFAVLYPAVNIGVNNYPAAPGAAPVPTGNNGVAAVTINSTSQYPLPNGYTFLGDWQFKEPIGTTGGGVLSNNNKTMTVSNGVMYQAIAVGNTALSGQCVYSVTMTWPGTSVACNGVGVANSSFSPTLMSSYGQGANQGYVGYDANSLGIYDNGLYYFNSGSNEIPTNTLPVGASFQKTNGTNIIDVAVDIPNLLMWYRVDNGPWNNFVNANPTIDFGGINLTYLAP